MIRKTSTSILILVIFFLGGCQPQNFETNEPSDSITPSFQNTLEVGEKNTLATATPPFSTATSTNQTQPSSTSTPLPTHIPNTPNEILPQVTSSNFFELAEKIDSLILSAGGRWHIVIKEVDGPTYYSLLPEQRINIASVVKVPLALLFFKTLEEKGIPENQIREHIQATGTGGRTFEQLLHAMLVKSEEDATNILYEYSAEYVNIPVQLREWQLQGIDLNARRYTAGGTAKVFERFYKGEFVSPTAQKLILTYLSEYTPNDDTRIGSLDIVIPAYFQIYNKRGSLLTPYVVADCAILENPNGSDYIIIIFAYNSEPKTSYEILDQTIGEIALIFWEYISTDKN